jgi:hypothetical protein
MSMGGVERRRGEADLMKRDMAGGWDGR